MDRVALGAASTAASRRGGPPTAADAVIAAARAAGIGIVFANPGTTEMWLVAALDAARPPLGRVVLGLQEAVCTGAADGYARIARAPAMALLHLGPGLANGLCNLHNARRARSPVIALVGDMATWHRGADAPLQSDLKGLAATQGHVFEATSPEDAPRAVADAVAAAVAGAVGGAGSIAAAQNGALLPPPLVSPASSVATVIVPHDVSWQPAASPAAAAAKGAEAVAGGAAAINAAAVDEAARAFARDCTAALKAAGARGAAAVLLGGAATLDDDGALRHAGELAALTGAHLYVSPLFARADRGAGRPHLRRLPYFPQEAARALAAYDAIALIDALPPVAPFGYDGGPSRLLDDGTYDARVWEVDVAAGGGAAAALGLLAAEAGRAAGGATVTPGVNCRGVFAAAARPAMPPADAKLTAAHMCAVVAALQPEGAIIVDEALTSGGAYWDYSRGCPPFAQLALTGGAIGCGPPLALGAALAAEAAAAAASGSGGAEQAAPPPRRVINLQADGSAMYALQALWSQARERARVLTVVAANGAYAILRLEGARQGVPCATGATAAPAAAAAVSASLSAAPSAAPPRRALPPSAALTSLSDPAIDWVALAAGMGVPGAAAGTVGELAALVERGLREDGPFLIQANIA